MTDLSLWRRPELSDPVSAGWPGRFFLDGNSAAPYIRCARGFCRRWGFVTCLRRLVGVLFHAGTGCESWTGPKCMGCLSSCLPARRTLLEGVRFHGQVGLLPSLRLHRLPSRRPGPQSTVPLPQRLRRGAGVRGLQPGMVRPACTERGRGPRICGGTPGHANSTGVSLCGGR